MLLLSDSQFIGRAEPEVQMILSKLFPKAIIKTQVPITQLILPEEAAVLDQEVLNHKCDMTVQTANQYLVVEVNYAHKEKAAKKWRKIFAPALKRTGKIAVTIDDYDCIHLFKKGTHGHKMTWEDYQDVINQLIKAGVKP